MSGNRESRSPVAIVTGAGQGIGKAIALKLASDGYSVVLGDLLSMEEALHLVNQECASIQSTLSNSPSLRSLHMACDVSVEDQVKALVDKAVNELGGLEVMVANAGVGKLGLLTDIPGEDLDFHYNINVKGVFYCYRAAARVMTPAGYGRIIGACSIAGKETTPRFGAYCMSKAAMRSLTHTAAQEWGPSGVTVNAYAPGPVDTNMLRQFVMGGEENPELETQIMATIPTGKMSTPEQIAALVAFLVSPGANNINGQVISVNGGKHMD
ncbi:NAD(P)-binding protein [Ceratobasidium sp. AG-I]|nr:NAD(P)-binding protein [Ceratobasidium sp. AG-I]